MFGFDNISYGCFYQIMPVKPSFSSQWLMVAQKKGKT